MKIVMAIGKRHYQKILTRYVAATAQTVGEIALGPDCLIDDKVCKWAVEFTSPRNAETHEMEIR